jgi:hypothetical protein
MVRFARVKQCSGMLKRRRSTSALERRHIGDAAIRAEKEATVIGHVQLSSGGTKRFALRFSICALRISIENRPQRLCDGRCAVGFLQQRVVRAPFFIARRFAK